MTLSLSGLTKEYDGKCALNGVTLDIPRGGFTGIIGRSGAGKSTLLRLINRLIEPTSGEITHDGIDVRALRGKALRAWRADAAMIFQQFNLVPRLDVLTNVLTGTLGRRPAFSSFFKWFSVEERRRAVALLERFDLGDTWAQAAGTLSGGQQQRVAIARAMMQAPKLILADEPIASLDVHNGKVVMDMLAAICRQDGLTIICNLHDLDAAMSYCDRLIGLAAGSVVFDGPPAAFDAAARRAVYGDET